MHEPYTELFQLCRGLAIVTEFDISYRFNRRTMRIEIEIDNEEELKIVANEFHAKVETTRWGLADDATFWDLDQCRVTLYKEKE